MSRDRIAEIIVDQAVDRRLDYTIPEGMKITPGMRVEVPLRGKKCLGIVLAIKASSPFTNLKPIEKPFMDEEIINHDLLELSLWMANYYMTPLRKVLKTVIPSSIRANKKAKEQFFVIRLKTKEELVEEIGKLRLKGSPQAEVLDVMLKTVKGILLTELMDKSGATRSPIDTLVKRGFLKLDIVRIDRSPLIAEEYIRTAPKKLNLEQQEALNKITAETAFKVHLLYGITGSGKTEVYLQAIDHTLKQGKGAIMLVPEISLTEQTIQRFRSRFEGHIAILHHLLSEGERLDEWRRIKEGKASIVIGARSSVFSPLPNLGLIIIDEEHEASYKQSDESPRYHAREVAIMRAKLTGAQVVLGSATPSLETYYNASHGKYAISRLTARADAQNLPKVKIVDMKTQYEKAGGFTLFSEELLDGIKKRMAIGEQTLIFLNRRGYHTCQKCLTCGEAVKCRHCDTTLTFHKHEKELSCHLCAYTLPPLSSCPSCRSQNPLKFKGFGTEQVEAALHAIFPEIRTLRMDRDTTKHKGSHQRLFRDFCRGKADVLIGTQMIAKGLHFPEVTLVGVLSCDTSLNIPDFRASETTFQLLTQVAGRAGRTRPGEVILQTLSPDNRTIALASHQDYATFFQEEIDVRKMFNFPPFAHIVKITASAPHPKLPFTLLEQIRQSLRNHLSSDYDIHPAIPSGHAKVKDQYRYQFLIRGPSSLAITRALHHMEFPAHPEVKVGIDVGPLSTFF